MRNSQVFPNTSSIMIKYDGQDIFLERSNYKGKRLWYPVTVSVGVGGVDVDPDVHLLVLLLIVDPPGQGGEREVKAHNSILTARHWQLNISTISRTESVNKGFEF